MSALTSMAFVSLVIASPSRGQSTTDTSTVGEAVPARDKPDTLEREQSSDGDAPVTAEEKPGAIDWFKWDRAGGDWGGVRTDLEDHGIRFDIFYNHFYGIVTNGGRDLNNAQRNSGTADILLRLDFEKMGLIPGGSMLVFTKGHFSRNINTKVGAISDPFDDADGDKVIYVDHLHYQQDLFKKKLQVRVGYLDQQLALDRNAYANSEDKQFFNTYLDNNNAIIPLTIGLGATVFVNPTDWLGFVVGAADGDARLFRTGFDTAFHDGADFFGYFQTDLKFKFPSPRGDLPGNYRIGVFYDPRTKRKFETVLDGQRGKFETGDVGLYLSFDQMLYRENPDDMQGLGWFFRYGYRDGEVNRIQHFWSTGAQYEGLIPSRDRDVLGFGMYSALASQNYRNVVDDEFRRETGYELYYKIQVTPWLTFTPDLQYVFQPGGLESADDAFVIGFRTRVTF